MALRGSAGKHVSSSGVTTRLGALPARRIRPSRRPLLGEASRPPKYQSSRARSWHLRFQCGSVGSLSGVLASRRLRLVAPVCSPHVCSRVGAPVPVPPFVGGHAPTVAVAPFGARRAVPHTRHRMRQDYPLNLSISLSGGEETNQDAPSNGE